MSIPLTEIEGFETRLGGATAPSAAELSLVRAATSGSFDSRLDTLETDLGDGSTFATLTGAQTLTNKRVTKRVKVLPYNDATQTVGETADYNTDLADMFICGTPVSSHGIAAGMDFGAPGGTPTEGQKLIFRLYFATAQTITWNAVFASRGVTLPGAASGGTAKYVTVGFLYNSLASTWDCVALATEA